jgi:hypothetical protein
MRSSTRWVLLAALSLAPVSVFAQGPVQPPPPATPAPAAEAAPAPSGSAPASGDKAEEPKKPSTTPGYSWTDKPQKRWVRKKKKKLDPNAPIATYPSFRMLKDGRNEV